MRRDNQAAASMESSGGGPLPRRGDEPAAAAASGKKLRRVMRAVYLVVVKKHQPKLAALGVNLHRLLSNKRPRGELSCRSMDPAAAVVHPLPRDHHHVSSIHRRKPASSSSSGPTALAASLSCRSMDPAAAAYRPREVQFSFKSTPPLHNKRCRRRRRRRRAQTRLQLGLGGAADHHHPSLELEYYHHGSAAAVSRLFELMDDVEEEEAAAKATATDAVDYYDEIGDMEAAAAWPGLSVGPAPRQVRITDSPFSVKEAAEETDDRMVDRRADEFITWFHEQLRTQQQQRAAVRERGNSYYWTR